MQKQFIAALAFGIGCLATANAQQDAAMTARPLSLNDCIQIALQHNLSLQVERINPEIAQSNLSIAYAGWDPSFTANFNHNFRQQPGNVDEFNRTIPGTSSETDFISAGVNGQLPTGLGYNISANVSDTSFESAFIDPITGLPIAS